jgi:hypothetical protein
MTAQAFYRTVMKASGDERRETAKRQRPRCSTRSAAGSRWRSPTRSSTSFPQISRRYGEKARRPIGALSSCIARSSSTGSGTRSACHRAGRRAG